MSSLPIQFVDESPAALNGTQGPFVVESPAMKRTSGEAGLDSDSDSETELKSSNEPVANSGPRPGKKTKGRVKIKMEFIENKLRRYTTFSKRKTGIMKKAYELSTLTGTQVMLLVASETGHVYTFATRKLQPMITSESGKALIQTCLNSPDAPPAAAAHNLDQRMNPTGFEEPELSYGISEDEQGAKTSDSPSMAQLYSNTLESSPSPNQLGQTGMVPGLEMIKRSSSPLPGNPRPAHSGNNGLNGLNSFMPTGSPTSTPSPNSGKGSATSTLGLTAATQLFLPSTATASTVSSSPGQQQQTLYRLPTPGPGQIVNLPAPPTQNNNKDNTQTSASSSGSGNPPGTFMYQTPQGVVYATAQSGGVPSLPEGYILNLPQTPTLQGVVPEQPAAGGTQQYITIPVPVSLAAGGAQVLQPMIAQAQAQVQAQAQAAAAAAASSSPSMVQQLSKSK